MERHLSKPSIKPDDGIFHFTETFSLLPAKPKLSDILTSCNDLKDGMTSSWKGLRRDCRKSLDDYMSVLTSLERPKMRKWRSQPRYAKGRNRILALLSGKRRPKDEAPEDIFTALLFPRKGQSSEFSDKFKFTIPDVFSPRMTHLLQSNRRPFGGQFSSIDEDYRPNEFNEMNSSNFLSSYLKEEIGKYHTNRMDRILRVSKEEKHPLQSSRSVKHIEKQRERRRNPDPDLIPVPISHKRIPRSPKLTLPPLPGAKAVLSHLLEEEQPIFQDMQREKMDMAEMLRSEQLMVGAQLTNRKKAFNGRLEGMIPRN